MADTEREHERESSWRREQMASEWKHKHFQSKEAPQGLWAISTPPPPPQLIYSFILHILQTPNIVRIT